MVSKVLMNIHLQINILIIVAKTQTNAHIEP